MIIVHVKKKKKKKYTSSNKKWQKKNFMSAKVYASQQLPFDFTSGAIKTVFSTVSFKNQFIQTGSYFYVMSAADSLILLQLLQFPTAPSNFLLPVSHSLLMFLNSSQVSEEEILAFITGHNNKIRQCIFKRVPPPLSLQVCKFPTVTASQRETCAPCCSQHRIHLNPTVSQGQIYFPSEHNVNFSHVCVLYICVLILESSIFFQDYWRGGRRVEVEGGRRVEVKVENSKS